MSHLLQRFSRKLRSLLGGMGGRGRRPRKVRKTRPQVEPLEERVLLSLASQARRACGPRAGSKDFCRTCLCHGEEEVGGPASGRTRNRGGGDFLAHGPNLVV